MFKVLINETKVINGAFNLAIFDLKSNKNRSVISFFWITLGFIIFIFSKAYLFSIILNVNFNDYIYYLSISILYWMIISSLITDAPKIFRKKILKDTVLPNNFFVYHLFCQKILIFVLSSLLPIFLILYLQLNEIRFFYLILNFLIFFLLFYYLIFNIAALGILNKDIDFFLQTIMKVLFFVTPVIWSVDKIPSHYHHFLMINPFYHFLELLRNPLMGMNVSTITYLIIFIIIFFNFLIYKFLSKKILKNAPKYI